ncbi:uncharacterized protein LOC6493413 isoform X3 [Drosophila ananassae]|nr:uncharacterized protein LOC6493413 isoform X3 [Drosophila ananassae]
MKNKEDILEQGYCLFTSNFKLFADLAEPFFFAFDVFHLKDMQNAPKELYKWKIFSIAFSTLKGDLQIVYLKAMTTGVNRLGSASIKEGVEIVHNTLLKKPSLHHKLVCAIANKCAANMTAISYLQSMGIPVIYDLNHFTNTMKRNNNFEEVFNNLFMVPNFNKSNFLELLGKTKDLVEKIVPEELQHRYFDEILSVECMLKRLFNAFPQWNMQLFFLNSNRFELLGAKLCNELHSDAEEGFFKINDLKKPQIAIKFIASLTTVKVHLINLELKKNRKWIQEFNQMMDEEEAPRPSKRPKWNTDTVEEFFETHLAKEGGGKSSYSVVEDADDDEEEDYLRTNRI